jgi:hypothetical protein
MIARGDQEAAYLADKGDDALERQRAAGAPRCSSCHAHIYWAVTDAGKRMPINVVDDEGGNVFLFRAPPGSNQPWRCKVGRQDDPTPQGATRHFSHFATCPHANDHRR